MFSKDLGLSQDLIDAVKAITEASCSGKKMEKEELHPNQVKLDKNKNGKLDADDFKRLRKEQFENLEEADGTVNSGRAQHGLDGDDEKKEHADYMKKKHNVTTKYHSVKGKSGASYDDELSYHGSKENVKKAIKDHYGPSMGQEAKEFHPHLFKEEVEELDELSKGTLANYAQKAAHDVGNKMYDAGQKRASATSMTLQGLKSGEYYDRDAAKQHSKALSRLQGIKTAAKKLAKEEFTLEDYSLEEIQDFMMSEDFEQLDELSKKTLGSYVKQASYSAANSMHSAATNRQTANDSSKHGLVTRAQYHSNETDKALNKAQRRLRGVTKATNKLTKEEIEDFIQTEAYEQLDELSKNTLGSYVKKAANDMGNRGAALAHKQASAAEVDRMTNRNDIKDKFDAQDKMKAALGADSKSQQKDYDKIGKRQSGISKAVTKLTKEQVEEIEMLAAKHGLGE